MKMGNLALEVGSSFSWVPASCAGQPSDEGESFGRKIDHSALGVPNDADMPEICQGEDASEVKLTLIEICSRDPQRVPAPHRFAR